MLHTRHREHTNLSGNAGSNSITVHAIDQETGMLSSAVHRLELQAPVCLTFMT
ncbi:hypothetical protein [Sphaerochaeta sp.]|uniref:hypothetical protein n=1 Tax=Sphaerochaeta sp. TaxID=1972642 RepID=UPI002A36FCD5|nr:hypothetical protein [Sphaerochaeta sp.]